MNNNKLSIPFQLQAAHRKGIGCVCVRVSSVEVKDVSRSTQGRRSKGGLHGDHWENFTHRLMGHLVLICNPIFCGSSGDLFITNL